MANKELDQVVAAERIRCLLLHILVALVDDQDLVELQSEELNDGTCFRVRVGRGDVGELIGKQGRTARSIRTVLAAASMKHGHRFTLDILEEKSLTVSLMLFDRGPTLPNRPGSEHTYKIG